MNQGFNRFCGSIMRYRAAICANLFLLRLPLKPRRLESFFDGQLKLIHVGLFEGLFELVVGVFGRSGDSHPCIVNPESGRV